MMVRPGSIAHPDITYESLGKAFNLPLEHDAETLRRMDVMTTQARRDELAKASEAERTARNRMALFPIAKGGHGGNGDGGARSEVLYVSTERWVPVVRLGGKVRCAIPANPPAMRLSRYPQPLPAAPPRPHALPPASTGISQTIQVPHLHRVCHQRAR